MARTEKEYKDALQVIEEYRQEEKAAKAREKHKLDKKIDDLQSQYSFLPLWAAKELAQKQYDLNSYIYLYKGDWENGRYVESFSCATKETMVKFLEEELLSDKGGYYDTERILLCKMKPMTWDVAVTIRYS